MKVRVAYTVDHEDVPNIVGEIVVKCQDQLKRASQLKFNILNFEKTVAEVEEIKENLDIISTQLEDCLNLARGYIGIQTAPKEETRVPAEPKKEEVKHEQNE